MIYCQRKINFLAELIKNLTFLKTKSNLLLLRFYLRIGKTMESKSKIKNSLFSPPLPALTILPSISPCADSTHEYNRFSRNLSLLRAITLTALTTTVCTLGSGAWAQTPAPGAPTPTSPVGIAAPASSASSVVPFTGSTLDRIKNTGTITIGHRAGSIPISFSDDKKPLGYGVEICTRVAMRVKERLGLPSINVQYVEVDSSNRIPKLVSGAIDLECGSTTNNADRRKQVDFAIPYYISGVRMMTRIDSGIKEFADLKNKTAVFGMGTTAIKIVDKLNKERDMKIKFLEEKDFDSALAAVINKKADVFILDDLLLYGTRSKVPNPENLIVVGDFLSIEPIAIMVRKNDKIKAIVDKEVYELMKSGKINDLYSKWFEQPIPPKNNTLNIPKSGLLKDVIRSPIDMVGD